VTFSFDASRGLIVVKAELVGPDGIGVLQFALDTGATASVVNVEMLLAIGYDPMVASDRVQVTTGSGVEFAPRVELQRLTALGHERLGFPVLGHTLPPSAGVDGLLGLDFFRGLVLTLDFAAGQVHVSQNPPNLPG
jgi:predicted aspartyl protease